MHVVVVCAWCQAVLERAEDPKPLSHGMCLDCVRSTDALAFEALGEFSQTQLDALPVGIIELDREGRICLYNRREAEYSGLDRARVVGKRFFTEVAPCTHVAEFHGRFEQLVEAREPKREHLDFVFSFASGERMASISMNWDPGRERVTLIVELTD